MFLFITGCYKPNPDPEWDLKFKCIFPQSKQLTLQDKKDIIVACTGITNMYHKYDWSFTEVDEQEYRSF